MNVLKRSLTLLLILCMAAVMIPLTGITAHAEENPTIVVDGTVVASDVAPYIVSDRTLVPIAVIVNYLGGKSDWDQATQTATITYGDTVVVMRIGSAEASVNGKSVTLDVVPRIKNIEGTGLGRTMVPIRFVSESFGFKVDWEGDTETVIINTGKENPAPSDANVKISSVTLQANGTYNGESYTNIILQADGSLRNIASEGHWLTDPCRYYIDFSGAEYTSSVNANQSQDVSTSNVLQVRTGEPESNTARLAINMTEPEEPTILYSDDGTVMQILFRENRTSPVTPSNNNKKQTWTAGESDTTTKQGTVKYDTISTYNPYADDKLVVCIDPGHGTTTGGKRSIDGSLREWEFNRSVAYKLKSRLEAQGIQCVMTVGENETGDPSLADRVAVANADDDVDLFVSIHANAYGTDWNNANGWEVYSYKTGGVSELAAKFVESATFSAISQLRDRGAKTANFYVIKNSEMPAILIEHGFYTNKSEVELLKSDSFRNKLADADAAGIINFFNYFK